MGHFIAKNENLSDKHDKNLKIQEMSNWKTPQMRPCFEPICLSQKPKEGTFMENWENWGVGFMNTQNQMPTNLIECEKPTKKEKGYDNIHISVKPVRLCSLLITFYTQENALILDPFMGSGTTAIAAIQTGRRYIGFEKEKEYVNICNNRIRDNSNSNLSHYMN